MAPLDWYHDNCLNHGGLGQPSLGCDYLFERNPGIDSFAATVENGDLGQVAGKVLHQPLLVKTQG